MSTVQAGRYAEAREYLRGQMGHESAAVRDAFANWYMLSKHCDPKTAWQDYQRMTTE